MTNNTQLSQEVLQRRVFNPYYYDLHVKEFLVGKTKPYINSNATVLDVGAGVGQYSRWFAKHANHVKLRMIMLTSHPITLPSVINPVNKDFMLMINDYLIHPFKT
jgi:2-polyprenyl-3-methyl-5-hydroxy-6-metoxy-1,4-benzoquinol methylase